MFLAGSFIFKKIHDYVTKRGNKFVKENNI